MTQTDKARKHTENTTQRDGGFFNLPVVTLIALSFALGMSEFIMVGILPDIATGLKVSEVAVGNLVSLFALSTHRSRRSARPCPRDSHDLPRI